MITTHNQTAAAHTGRTCYQSNHWLPVAQWLAILTMTLEHTVLFIWPESPFGPWAITIGRVAFPAFAGMVAWHLLHNTQQPIRYGLRLLLIAAASQIPFAWVATADQLNVCFTLAAGLFAVILVDRITNPTAKTITVALLLPLAVTINLYFEFYIFGLLMVPAFVIAFRYRVNALCLLPVLALCLVINIDSLFYMAVSFVTACAVYWAPAIFPQPSRIPSCPRFLRLAWYPLHLTVIAGAIAVTEVAYV